MISHCPVARAVLPCHKDRIHFHLGSTMQRGNAMYCERDNDPATMDVCCPALYTSMVTGSLLRTEAFFSHMPDYILQSRNSVRSGYEGSRSRTGSEDPTLGFMHYIYTPSIFENYKCTTTRKNPTEYW